MYCISVYKQNVGVISESRLSVTDDQLRQRLAQLQDRAPDQPDNRPMPVLCDVLHVLVILYLIFLQFITLLL